MRLIKARIRGYRSIKDTGYFEIEKLKTILVGPNEAGKTAILQALQKLNPPNGVALFDPLRDYPRSKYDEDIISGKINPSEFTVVEGYFQLEDEDNEIMPDGFKNTIYVFGRHLDNTSWHRIEGGIAKPNYKKIEKDIIRLSAHIDRNYVESITDSTDKALDSKPSLQLSKITEGLQANDSIPESVAQDIVAWLDQKLEHIDEDNTTEEKRFDRLKEILTIPKTRNEALTLCQSMLPKFVLFNNYFRVKPSIHLDLLAKRTAQNILDDDQYDYGNNCLLKLLGFSARELSNAGNTSSIDVHDEEQYKKYKDQLDKRDYRLNSASVRLTKEIVGIWNPNKSKDEASKLRIKADGQYLKVVVEDDLGVEVELDQRSEGFQWIVSFFVVFFAEAEDNHKMQFCY